MPRRKTTSGPSSKAPRKRKPAAPAWTRRPEYVPGYTFEQERADRVIRFIESFVTMTSGRKFAGKPMKLMEWQKRDIIEPLYGWVDADGLRRYRRAAIYVSKKNGKSSLMAALVLYHLLADQEPGAAVYGAAVDRIQSGIIYRSVASAVRANPQLAKALEVIDSRSTIVHRETNSRYTCLAADSWRAEGIDASAVVVDELHAHKKPDLVQALTYAGAARTAPLVVAISTAGENRNGIGWQWYQDAKLVEKSPEANPTFFGKVYEAPEGADYADPKVWALANPSLGTTISEKDFAADYADSLTNPRKWAAFARYRLGVWVQGDNRWFRDPEDWAACGSGPLEPIDGRPCWVGVDLASNLDLTSAAFVFKEKDGTYYVEWKHWVPEATIADREREGIPYSQWIRQGFVTVTDGARLDHEAVARDIVEYAEKHRIVSVGADPWNVGSLATLLQRHDLEVQSISQRTGTLNAASKLLEALVVERKLRHGGNPVAAWAANHVCVYTDATGSIKPDKVKSTEKIDPIVALVNGLTLASTSDETGSDNWNLITI
jgi:phage terminase large subunit-like protein